MDALYRVKYETPDAVCELLVVATKRLKAKDSKSLDEFSKELAGVIVSNSSSKEDALGKIQQLSVELSLMAPRFKF